MTVRGIRGMGWISPGTFRGEHGQRNRVKVRDSSQAVLVDGQGLPQPEMDLPCKCQLASVPTWPGSRSTGFSSEECALNAYIIRASLLARNVRLDPPTAQGWNP